MQLQIQGDVDLIRMEPLSEQEVFQAHFHWRNGSATLSQYFSTSSVSAGGEE